jgi:hypothetical protein
MNDPLWQTGLRCAGCLHFATLVLACFTPIPPDWEANLKLLPLVHRRFAIAQNVSIGAMIAVLGLFSLFFSQEMVGGLPIARAVCLTTALFWGGRLLVLPWLKAHTCLPTPWLKTGFALLMAECATYAIAYTWLAIRPVP